MNSSVSSTPPLVLASISPRRHMLLGLLDIPFTVVPSCVDESRIEAPSPREFARIAARAKCLDVAARLADDAVVIGADTVVHFSGEGAWHCSGDAETLLGKPVDAEEARHMLRGLSGRAHRVTTAIAIARSGAREARVETETTRVRFHPLSADEIDAYVATGESLDKAGAYAVQGDGGRFIEAVDGDLQNVIGLPLRLLIAMLEPFYPSLAMPSQESLGRTCEWPRT